MHEIRVVHLGAAHGLTSGGRGDHTTDDQAVRPEPVDDPLELALEVERATLDDRPSTTRAVAVGTAPSAGFASS